MDLGNETFITVSLGRSFQIYKCDKLTPVVISPQMHAPIRCMAAQREVTFVGIGNHILIWKRVTLAATLTLEEGEVSSILVLGQFLICTDTAGHISVFHTNTHELLRKISLGEGFVPSALIHPNTYVNKVWSCWKRATSLHRFWLAPQTVSYNYGTSVRVNFIISSPLRMFHNCN